MADVLLTTLDDFVAYQGGSGSYRPTAVSDALMLAEGKVENWLNTALVPTSITEEVPWPVDDGMVALKKARLVSVTSVIALHTPSCSCQWTTVTDCAFIYNALHGIIRVVDCTGVGNRCWYGCRCPRRAQITYTYGFQSSESDPTTKVGKTLRSAIMIAALGYLQSGIGLDVAGDVAIRSWSSVGYSENREFNERGGAEEMIHPLIQQAKMMVRQLTVRQAIGMRGRKGTQYY